MGITTSIAQCKQAIVDSINQSKLPASVVELILENITNEVHKLSQEQLQIESKNSVKEEHTNG